MSDHGSVTRGHGLLESFLARRRIAMAERLIDPRHRQGRVLDYGCGSFPLFLSRTRFSEKVGLDQLVEEDADAPTLPDGIRLVRFDIEDRRRLPFDDAHFNVVTMLAVFEHVPRESLIRLLDEIDRVLVPGGQFIMTTPAGWTDPIIKALARLRLISPEEADEHETVYSHRAIRDVLDQTRLGPYPTRRGSFELGMNNWVAVTKPEPTGVTP